jgi:hypothetical protein
MPPQSPLEVLLRQARRRHLANAVVAGGVWVAAFTMGGVVLLLVAGTSMLSWHWLAAVFVAGLAWRLNRARKERVSDYGLAQRIDRRMSLQDTLSTALFFRNGAGRVSPEIRDAQRLEAEAESRGLDPRLAVPFCRPAALRVAAALCLAALGLLALRYGVRGSLDLRPPIARIVFEGFYGAQPEAIALDKRTAAAKDPNRLDAGGLAMLDPALGSAPGAEMATPAPSSSGAPGSESKASPNARQSAGQTGEEPPADRNHPPASGDSPDDRASEAESAQNPPAKPSSSNEDSDLLNKLRDAMADLLAKLKIQPPLTESREVASKSRGSQSGRSAQSTSRQAEGPGGRQSSEAQGSPQPGEQGESGDTAQAAQGQSGEQGSGRPDPRARERSGMGKEEGSKDVKEAEQLAAMGKISEILGKRAQNLTGDVMVEVTASQNQQLRTPYSQRKALHSDSGGEIHRDEIPLIFQHYVQQYYEEIRKSPPAVPAKSTAPGAGR